MPRQRLKRHLKQRRTATWTRRAAVPQREPVGEGIHRKRITVSLSPDAVAHVAELVSENLFLNASHVTEDAIETFYALIRSKQRRKGATNG